jgi:hypothetical protein
MRVKKNGPALKTATKRRAEELRLGELKTYLPFLGLLHGLTGTVCLHVAYTSRSRELALRQR